MFGGITCCEITMGNIEENKLNHHTILYKVWKNPSKHLPHESHVSVSKKNLDKETCTPQGIVMFPDHWLIELPRANGSRNLITKDTPQIGHNNLLAVS